MRFRNSSKNSMKKNSLASTACHRKLNGNMPVGLVHKQDFILVTMNQNLRNMHGTLKIQILKLIQLVRRNQISGDFMICIGKTGNGLRTDGMIIIKALLMMVMLGKISFPGSLEVVAGATALVVADQLFATIALLVTVSPILVFAS